MFFLGLPWVIGKVSRFLQHSVEKACKKYIGTVSNVTSYDQIFRTIVGLLSPEVAVQTIHFTREWDLISLLASLVWHVCDDGDELGLGFSCLGLGA